MPTPMKSPSLVNILSHRMDYLVERQGVLSGNIANASTPGYVARDLTFEKMVDFKPGLTAARTNPNHLSARGEGGQSGELVRDYTNIRHDGNSVKLDEQFLKMNDVQLSFTTASRIYQKQKELQMSVLRGR
ncbi:MAG: flagellar basal body rod protein FlgB [Proteobacteria bacterium]|nr:flagellar basal body rod protein FlgB [Pseudomonadota bacterium]